MRMLLIPAFVRLSTMECARQALSNSKPQSSGFASIGGLVQYAAKWCILRAPPGCKRRRSRSDGHLSERTCPVVFTNRLRTDFYSCSGHTRGVRIPAAPSEDVLLRCSCFGQRMNELTGLPCNRRTARANAGQKPLASITTCRGPGTCRNHARNAAPWLTTCPCRRNFPLASTAVK